MVEDELIDYEVEPDDPDESDTRTIKPTNADDEQAEWLARAFEQKVRYDHTAKRWHIWNGTRWAPDKTKQVQRDVMDLAGRRLFATAAKRDITEADRKRLLKNYRSLLDISATERALVALSTRPDYKTDGADWDQDPFLLGCENGIVDLRVNALVDRPAPTMLVTMTTGHKFVPFDPSIESFADRAPRFWPFLMEITSQDMNLAVFYLLWFGYSLFGLTTEQKFLILTGLGRNGKGALVTAMRHVFGDYSANADSNLYMRSKFGSARSDSARSDLMELKGKRLAVMSEPDGGVFNEEMLKAHTGGDPIVARALYSNNVLQWSPTHTITFLTNEPPKVNDIGPSMAARVMVADFRERFDGEREDKKLYEKLMAEAEGILAILCWAAKVWVDSDHGLDLPDRVSQASAEYLTSNDPLARALEEAFQVVPGVKTSAKVLYDAYTEWHARSNEPGDPISQTAFGLSLARKGGFNKEKTRNGVVYTNIRPLSAMQIAEADDDEA